VNLESLQEKIKFFSLSLSTQIQEIEDMLLIDEATYAEERFRQIESETLQDILERFENIFQEILFRGENEI